MKSFKSFLIESNDLMKYHMLVFNPNDYVPIFPSTISYIFGTALFGGFWHYTDVRGLRGLVEIQRKANSISATNYSPWSYEGSDMLRHGVVTEGGVVAKVFGRALFSHDNDVYSFKDDHGNRWVQARYLRIPNSNTEFTTLKARIMAKYEVPPRKNLYDDQWMQIMGQLPEQDIRAIIYEYMKGCEDIIRRHKDAVAHYFIDKMKHDNKFEIILSNFKILGVAADPHMVETPEDADWLERLPFPVVLSNDSHEIEKFFSGVH